MRSPASDGRIAGRVWAQSYLQRGDKERAQRARTRLKDEINTEALTLAPFALGRYLVTNAQYAIFIERGGYDPEAVWWKTDLAAQQWHHATDRRTPGDWDDARFEIARPNHPVGVSWYEASACCRGLTQHLNDGSMYGLPSAAAWEYAARGTTRRVSPWGDAEPDAERANFNAEYQRTTAVGGFPAGATPAGVLDLAGNVWKWTRSAYRAYPYDWRMGVRMGVT